MGFVCGFCSEAWIDFFLLGLDGLDVAVIWWVLFCFVFFFFFLIWVFGSGPSGGILLGCEQWWAWWW